MEQLEDDLSHRVEADSVSRALALVGEKWTLPDAALFLASDESRYVTGSSVRTTLLGFLR